MPVQPKLTYITSIKLKSDQAAYTIDGHGNIMWYKPKYTTFSNMWKVSLQKSPKTPSLPTEMAPYNEHEYLKDFIGRFTKAKQFIKQWMECEKHSSKFELTKELLKWEATSTKLFLSKIKSNYAWDNKRCRNADWPILAYLPWYITDVQESSKIFFSQSQNLSSNSHPTECRN